MSRLKSALVTGATTPLGRRLCAALLGRGVSVLAVALEDERAARFLVPEEAAYAHVDLERPRDLHDAIYGPVREREVDTVFHLATHRRLGIKGARALNVEALRNLLACCDGHPTIGRVIYRSYAEVYRVEQQLPSVIDEAHPLELAPDEPQWLRDRVEADMLACARMGMAKLEVVVLRMADLFAAQSGSQLYDYVRSAVCLRPLGFDPMINVLSLDDAADALVCAGAKEQVQGVFNVPGKDTLPLSAAIRACKRLDLPLPGPILAPLYALRRRAIGTEFSYRLNKGRMHFPAILDGGRAKEALAYVPSCSALRARS
jgi:nucleoside-diphosphate-sugar epimerase